MLKRLAGTKRDRGDTAPRRFDAQRPQLLRIIAILVTIYLFSSLVIALAFLLCAFFLDGATFWIVGWVLGALLVTLGVALISSLAIALRLARERSIDAMKKTLSVSIAEAGAFGQVGMITVDENGIITWISDYLQSNGFTGVNQPVETLYPGIKECAVSEDSPRVDLPLFTFKHRSYRVWYSSKQSCYYLKDDTRAEALRIASREEEPIVGLIRIDNYSDIENKGTDIDWAGDMEELRRALSSLENTYRIWIGQLSESSFVLLGQHRNLEDIEADGYILCSYLKDSVERRFTVSIGIASGDRSLDILFRTASDAVEVAISRGGDQLVIAPSGENMIYVGESKDTSHSNIRRYLATWCRGLVTEIRNSDSVIIVPPLEASFSDLGAVLGLFALSRATAINTRWIYEIDTLDNRVRSATAHTCRKALESGEAISAERARELLTSNTLVISVGGTEPFQTAAPWLFRPKTRTVIISVNRDRPDLPGIPVISPLSSRFSCTAEQVASLLEVAPVSVTLTGFNTTLMYAGILEATNGFTKLTTADTFAASSFLQTNSADVDLANDLLKEPLEEFAKRADILATAEMPFPRIVICYDPDWREELTTAKTINRSLDSSMGIAEVRASFILARTEENIIIISSSSDGSLDVHQVLSAVSADVYTRGRSSWCYIEGTDVDENRRRLISALASYLGVPDPYAKRKTRKKNSSSTVDTLQEATSPTIATEEPSSDQPSAVDDKGGAA